MASTSGTTDRSQVNVAKIIDHAARRCGKAASTLSGEQVASAIDALFFLLCDLANRGVNLWCIQKYVLAVSPFQTRYDLPSGMVDALNVLYRTTNTLSGTPIAGAGYQGLSLASAAEVDTVGAIFAANGTVNLVVDSSNDGILWTQRAAFASALNVTAGSQYYADVDNTAVAAFWRIRDTSGTLATVTQLVFGNTPSEVPMTPLNRDDYATLPNKSFSAPTGSRSLQYWLDKQAPVPRMWVWPASQGSVDQIVVWAQRQIQDVGAMANLLDVPNRWLESIILTLSVRVCLELPQDQIIPGRLEYLKDLADEHLLRAEDGESDGSPIRLSPNIAGYTA